MVLTLSTPTPKTDTLPFQLPWLDAHHEGSEQESRPWNASGIPFNRWRRLGHHVPLSSRFVQVLHEVVPAAPLNSTTTWQ